MVGEKMKNLVFRRFLAYVVDIIIVSAISSLLAMIPFLNPQQADYDALYKEVSDVLSTEITDENSEEITQRYEALYYDLNRANVNYVVIHVVVLIAYFGVFQWQNKGQTLGKRILKLRVVSANEKERGFFSYFLRAVLLHNILITIGQIVVILVMSKENYYLVYNSFNTAGYVILYSILFCMVLRSDHRGIHDLLAQTKVVMEEDPAEMTSVKMVRPSNEQKDSKKTVKEKKVQKAKVKEVKSTKPKK